MWAIFFTKRKISVNLIKILNAIVMLACYNTNDEAKPNVFACMLLLK